MALQNSRWGSDGIGKILSEGSEILFLGIGGVNMASLAKTAKRKGFSVFGYDRSDSERIRYLQKQGIKVEIGNEATLPKACKAIVYSLAVPEELSVFSDAEKCGIPLISRADFLNYIAQDYPVRIAVSGMNGKSTVTALCGEVLQGSESPTVFCGADVIGWQGCDRQGNGRIFVTEACEYRDSFLSLDPTVAVILNIGWDHVDYFADLEQVRASFRQFAQSVGPSGTVIANADDGETVKTLEGIPRRILWYGENSKAEVRAVGVFHQDGYTSFDLCRSGERLCRIRVPVAGKFQIGNALAACSVALLLEENPSEIARKVACFSGVRRRMEYKGIFHGARFFSDYAHHPSAIRVVLQTAKEMNADRIVTVFQSHTYSRTAGLLQEFAEALGESDRVILPPIYAAREIDDGSVSAQKLAALIGNRATAVNSLQEAAGLLKNEVRSGDLVLVMGAGDVDSVFRDIPLLFQ